MSQAGCRQQKSPTLCLVPFPLNEILPKARDAACHQEFVAVFGARRRRRLVARGKGVINVARYYHETVQVRDDIRNNVRRGLDITRAATTGQSGRCHRVVLRLVRRGRDVAAAPPGGSGRPAKLVPLYLLGSDPVPRLQPRLAARYQIGYISVLFSETIESLYIR